MTWFIETFVDPVVRYGFMRDALVVAVVVGATSAVLSCLLVVRRQALLGDAIAHAVLLGVAVGWLVAGSLGVFWGALAVGICTGLSITFIERMSRVKMDAAMGVVFTTAFALGLVIISRERPAGIDLFHVLFGNIIGVTRQDVLLTTVSGSIVLAIVAVLYRDLLIWSFDVEQAQVLGVPTGALSYLFIAILSASIVASLQAVGIVLAIALLIIPGATAYVLAERLASMMRIAAASGILAGLGGVYSSYHADVASGPAIVLAAAALFLLAFTFAPKRGLFLRILRRRTNARRAAAVSLLKAITETQRRGGNPVPLDQVDAEMRPALRMLVRRGWVTVNDSAAWVTPAGQEASASYE